MRIQYLAVLISLGIILPMSAAAFECPIIGKQTQAQIDKVSGTAKGLEYYFPNERAMKQVMALLSVARAELAGGMASHNGAKGKGDHAVAVAKIKSASGHAYAAASLLKFL